MNRLTCLSKIVVVGTVIEKESQFTENGGFIFTDYDYMVNQILKNDDTVAIEINHSITIAGLSGAVISHGHRIEVFDEQHQPLMIGQQYLLFLDNIPGTTDFKGVTSWHENSFVIADNQISQVSNLETPLGKGVHLDLSTFLNKVAMAINTPCKK